MRALLSNVMLKVYIISYMEPTTAWLWYRGLRRHLGEYRQKQWKYCKKLWRVQNPEPRDGYICWLCLRPCNLTRTKYKNRDPVANDMTLDHVIPVDVILQDLDKYDIRLCWDPSNLKPAHHKCNGIRSADETVRPPEYYRNWRSRDERIKDARIKFGIAPHVRLSNAQTKKLLRAVIP